MISNPRLVRAGDSESHDGTTPAAGLTRRSVLKAWAVAVPGWGIGTAERTSRPGSGSGRIRSPERPRSAVDAAEDVWSQDAVLTPDESSPGERFGYAVAIDGTRALVGAESAANGGPGSGAAYVFETSDAGWRQVQKLTAADANAEDRFGDSVALDGGRALVGARGDDEHGPDAGAAYVFEPNDDGRWHPNQKLSAADASPDDRFGRAVALDGDRAFVGARRDDEAAKDAGAAYVFELAADGWNQVQKLTAGDPDPDDRFGRAIAVDGSRALVGARIDDGRAPDAGAAYVFERDADEGRWRQTQKLTAPDAHRGDRFGSAVALRGDRALVGAERDDETAEDAGAVYAFVFDAGQWRQTQKLTVAGTGGGTRFGSTLALDRGTALVGAEHDAEHGSDAGAAYGFTLEGDRWRPTGTLVATNPAPGDRFGSDVAVDGNRALVGASDADEEATDAGAVYAFSRDAADGEGGQTVAGDSADLETTVAILAGVVTIVSGAIAAVRYLRDREVGPQS